VNLFQKLAYLPASLGLPAAWVDCEWVLPFQVAQAYLEHLLKEGRFAEAAKLCPRLLKVGNTALRM